ncbi:type II toxin-antitoxin system RelE family toxin [Treponema vincentii]|uniref:type II toxin-antitoxin system RelE family toxin n=1 Tax=Treponema vincentii TaxID=69710 RepID=UPI0020A2A651|nr:type II toxin-antitoxin system mRNA interferase toxin, RelE/StbE family [Treponema vincentii]UTC47477.1 type II toxin-antitoxin system mRNA interferase toxin, RelE/StbE family [Treponema vincentii]
MYTIKLTQIAAEFIAKLDGKSQQQIMEKIEVLKEYPLKVGKPLKGNLQDYRSIRSVGQRYRIIYQVKETEVEVIVVAVGIRRDGDKKNDIYELMKKYVKIGLFSQ